jgi:putative heme transporter
MESKPTRRILHVDVTTASLVRIGVFAFGAWLLTQLWDVVLVVVIALIFAGTLSPLVAILERRLSRGWAVAAVVVSLLTVVGAVSALAIPPLVSQVSEFAKEAPDLFHQATDYLYRIHALSRLVTRSREIDVASVVNTYGERALQLSTAAASLVGYAVTAIVLSIYFLADPLQAKAALFVLVPRSYHVRTARILGNLEVIVGGYMRGQAITSVAMMLFTLGLLVACGVPSPLPLALFAGLADVIPMIGGILAVTPCVLSALPSGVGVGVIIAAGMILYQEFENRVLAPRVYGQALRLRPAAVTVALLVGGKLMGILGALLALPLTAAILMIIEELRVEMPGDHTTTPAHKREQRGEARYTKESAGASTEQAVVLAESIAAASPPPAVPKAK